MTKEMKEYIATLKRLKKLGQKVIDNSYNSDIEQDSWDKVSEVECMDEHLNCCFRILGIQ